MPPAPGVLSESTAFELTEIRSSAGSVWGAFAAGRYRLEKDGKFTALVEGIAGDGRYIVAGTTVVFYYNGNFLDELAKLGHYPVYGTPSGQEVARMDGDFLRFTRCLTEDCYEFSWAYKKLR